VSRSYRLGLKIVVSAVLFAALACAAATDRAPVHSPPAGQDLGPGALPLGDFQFTERSGRTVTEAELRDRIWIASFIFTRCPLSCPRISTVMKGLQDRLKRTSVLLVSISVDPDHDTAAVLAEYAARFGASPDRWWFLTGPKASTYALVQDRFKLGLRESTASDRAVGAESITHSDRLALVDRGRVVGFFDSSDLQALTELVARASRLAQPSWVRGLPTLNASLNALCAGFLIVGWIAIRRRSATPASDPLDETAKAPVAMSLFRQPAVRTHAACMLLAVATSIAFLASYLVYHFQAGSMPFRHGGQVRLVYFTILLSHTALATFAVAPLVAATLLRAVRREFAGHARTAQVTLPIWLYVSITGVIIYLMLYHFPAAYSGQGQL
jgi:protein SCO1/2/putative membrane protein